MTIHLANLDPIIDEPSLRLLTQLLHRQQRHVVELPASESHALESDLLAPALRLLAELVRRLQRVRSEERVPLNAWLHDGPHWHLELFPRTTKLAGLELGAGVYIDSVAPEDAAVALRR